MVALLSYLKNKKRESLVAKKIAFRDSLYEYEVCFGLYCMIFGTNQIVP